MHLSRANSEINLYSPFLLKFEGRMAQISKKGTLTVPPPVFAASFQRDAKKLTSQLAAKRADNILLALNEVRDKNAKAILHMTNHGHDTPLYEQTIRSHENYTTVARHESRQMIPSVMEGSFSKDFRRMLKQLDNISMGKNGK